MNEPAWQNAEIANDFFMVLPMDTSHSAVKTEVRMTYDNDKLYIIAVCYKKLSGPNMVESLRRDFNFGKNDNFIFFLDTYDDLTTGFSFGANADGAQWDGNMNNGNSIDLNWDTKWVSEVKNYPDKWIFESAIPFKSIRYKKGNKEWGVNFSRNDLKTTEKSSWTPIPRQFPTASLAYTGTLVWDDAPPVEKKNIAFIPYALTNISKDYIAATKTEIKPSIGFDAKVAITSSLNLDLTVHPDFSQVEIDQQVTNLGRFELFFPEKRQFFLENSDLLTNFGVLSIRPFFSRRIGLNAPILGGGKLSGNLNKDWRISALDMQTRAVDDISLPAQNFAVLSLQKKVFSRSNITFIYVGKESVNYSNKIDSGKVAYSLFNRNIGLEYNLVSPNNRWIGKSFVLKSFSPSMHGDDIAHSSKLEYTGREWNYSFQYTYLGQNYNAEAGYIERTGYIKFKPTFGRTFLPKGGSILTHGPQFISSYFYDTHMHSTDNETSISYPVTFRNRFYIAPIFLHDYVILLKSFDPTHRGIDSLAKGSKHEWNTVGIDIQSQPQKIFTYSLSIYGGGFYDNGSLLSINANMGYRFQPYINIAVSGSYNHLKLPSPWGNSSFFVIGPKIDVTLTNKFFFTTYIQYNNQQDNLNINARLQWRYKPASDFYIVYTDNYYPGSFIVKNKALVLKYNYWFNL